MNSRQMHVITIIADTTLEAALCSRLRQLGVKRYSVVEAETNSLGKDCKNTPNRSHIRIDSTLQAEMAQNILARIQEEHGANSSVICFISDTQAVQHLGEPTGTSHAAPKEIAWGDYLISL
jgi:hypothetical protein